MTKPWVHEHPLISLSAASPRSIVIRRVRAYSGAAHSDAGKV